MLNILRNTNKISNLVTYTYKSHQNISSLFITKRNIVSSSVLSRHVNPRKTESLPEPQKEDEGFGILGVAPWLTQMLQINNMTEPTDIQKQAIPTLLQGTDGLIGSQTGSGKTMTFLIPVIQNMIRDETNGIETRPNRPRAMILVPTRELGAQVLAMAKSLCHHSDARFRAAFATGGESKVKQREVLRGQTSFAARRATSQISSQERYKVVAISVPIRLRMRALGMDKQLSREISYVKAKWIRSKIIEYVQNGEMNDKDMIVLFDADTNHRELSLTPRGANVMNRLLREYNQSITLDNTHPEYDERDVQRTDVEFNDNILDIFASGTDSGKIFDIKKDPQLDIVEEAFTTTPTMANTEQDDEDKAWDLMKEDEDEVNIEEFDDSMPPLIDEDGNENQNQVRSKNFIDDEEDGWITFDDIDVTSSSDNTNNISYRINHQRSTPEEILGRNRNVDLIVGTPGRIRALMATDELFLSDLRSLVFDEADFLFHHSNGFDEDLDAITKPLNRRLFNDYAKQYKQRAKEDPLNKKGPLTPTDLHSDAIKKAGNTQLIFAGASLQREFVRSIRETFPLYRDTVHSRSFAVLQSKTSMCLPQKLRQTWVRLGGKDKMTVIKDLLSSDDFQKEAGKVFKNSIIVFCNSVQSARAVAWTLNEAGISAVGSHGDIPPKLRAQYWNDFVRKRASVMVCTDLASRGLDTRFVSKIINFDFPTNPVVYLHRVGRTARAGDVGHVVSLLSKGDEVLAKAIDRAHKVSSPIANLSGSHEVYRPDLPPALRPGASTHEVKAFAPSVRDVRSALKERESEDRRENQRLGTQRRVDRKQRREDERIARQAWNRSSGRGTGRAFDVSVENKIQILQRARQMRKYEETHGKGAVHRDFKSEKKVEHHQKDSFDMMTEAERKKTTKKILGMAREKQVRHVRRGDETVTQMRKRTRAEQEESYRYYQSVMSKSKKNEE